MHSLRIIFILYLTIPACLVRAHNESAIQCDVTVIDYSGRPVDGAQVFALCGWPDYSEGKPIYEKVSEAIADLLGHARLQWPSSEKDYFVFAYKPGLSFGWSLVRCWNPRQKIFLQLGKPLPLGGTVVDDEGLPVAGAVVQIIPQSASEFNFSAFGYDVDLPFLKTRTDSEGRFFFRILSEDITADFFVTHPDYAPHYTNASSKAFGRTYRPGREEIAITVSKACRIFGKVIDEEGKGLAHVPVHARLAGASADYKDCFVSVSGDDGSFTLTNLPEETFIVTTGRRHEDQSRWPSFGCMVRTHKEKPVRAAVKVKKGFPVEFVVIEPQTKHLIPNASVDLTCMQNSDDKFYYRALGKTDGSGRVTLPCSAGTCYVSVWAEGYNGMWPTPRKMDKTVGRIPVYLNPEEASVSGRVLDPDGKPAAGVWVYPMPNMSKTNDLTNADGSFSFQFQPSSKKVYVLTQDLEKNLCALAEVTEDQKEYTLQLQKGLIVKGKVTDLQGRPIAGALVEQRCDIPHTITLLGEKALSDAKGEYTLRAVPMTQGPMTYTFRVFAAGFGGGEIRKLKMEEPQEEYIVPDLKLLAADCTVSGIVVDEKGNPLPDLPVFLDGSRGSQNANQIHDGSCSDSDGRFFFPRACRGPIKIQAGWAHEDPGILYACGGDQDLRVIFHKNLVHPEHPAMVGRPLPTLDFGDCPVDPNQIEGKQVAVCFWSMETKIEKQTVAFSRQMEELKRDDISVHLVSIWPLEPKKRDRILKQFSWPVYDKVTWTEMDLLRRAWGARDIPWFIVTDKQHIIIYEGTSLEKAKAALAQSAPVISAEKPRGSSESAAGPAAGG